MPHIVEPAMTVRDVAAFLNVDEKTIYRLAQKGDLPGFNWSEPRSIRVPGKSNCLLGCNNHQLFKVALRA